MLLKQCRTDGSAVDAGWDMVVLLVQCGTDGSAVAAVWDRR